LTRDTELTDWEFCAGEKGGGCVGRSRGGLTTKREIVVDREGTPLACLLEKGPASEIKLVLRVLARARAP